MDFFQINIYLLLLLSVSVIIYKCDFFESNKKNIVNKEKFTLEQEKMYNIIMLKGSIYHDPYKRTIRKSVVKKFCNIAKKYSINLDTITSDEFDFIYKKYVDHMIDKYNRKI